LRTHHRTRWRARLTNRPPAKPLAVDMAGYWPSHDGDRSTLPLQRFGREAAPDPALGRLAGCRQLPLHASLCLSAIARLRVASFSVRFDDDDTAAESLPSPPSVRLFRRWLSRLQHIPDPAAFAPALSLGSWAAAASRFQPIGMQQRCSVFLSPAWLLVPGPQISPTVVST